jgi:glutaredoxin
MNAVKPVALTLLGRAGCHLCIEVASWLDEAKLTYASVDIDDDPELSARWGLVIPVLLREDGASLQFPFDAEQLAVFQSGP